MKTATAYLVGEHILLQAMSLTESGVWIADGRVLTIPADDRSGLAEGIKTSLDASRAGVAHPSQSEWKSIQQPMLQAAGVRTWAALGKKAKAVGMTFAGEDVAFIPTVHFRAHGGHASDEHTIHRSMDDPDLGSGLLDAFAHAS